MTRYLGTYGTRGPQSVILTICDMKTFSAFSCSLDPCLNPRFVSEIPKDSFKLSTWRSRLIICVERMQ